MQSFDSTLTLNIATPLIDLTLTIMILLRT